MVENFLKTKNPFNSYEIIKFLCFWENFLLFEKSDSLSLIWSQDTFKILSGIKHPYAYPTLLLDSVS